MPRLLLPILLLALQACTSATVSLSVAGDPDTDLEAITSFDLTQTDDVVERNLIELAARTLERRGYTRDTANPELVITVEAARRITTTHVPATVRYVYRASHSDRRKGRRRHHGVYEPIYSGGYDISQYQHAFRVTFSDPALPPDGLALWQATVDATTSEPDPLRVGAKVIPDLLIEFPIRTDRPSVRELN